MLIRVSFQSDRGALGQDGDAALALQVVAVERALGHLLVVAEGAGLAQELIDQRGLAVVDMGDDRDVADLHKAPDRRDCCGAHIGNPAPKGEG